MTGAARATETPRQSPESTLLPISRPFIPSGMQGQAIEASVDWSAITRRTSLAWGFAALAALGTSGASQTTAARDWSSLDALARRAIAAGLTPGLQVSAMKAGQLVYSRGFGLANLAAETPVAATTMFRIGSLTKQFTAVALLLLSEEGKLSLDDRLQRFLPGFPRADQVSLRQMLTHSSGLPARPRLDGRSVRVDWDRESYLAAALSADPLYAFHPGTGFLYSNVAFHLLGWVIETASGQPYSTFLRTRLFDPIGLARTAVDDAGPIVAERASGYAEGARGEFRNADFISMTLPGAAGSLRSTADDLVRWHAALLAGEVLRPASLQAMLTPGRLNDGTLPTRPRSRNHPGPSRETIEYGLGIGLGTENGRRHVAHTGGINGFQSELKSYLAERVSVACLINMDGGRAGPDSRSGRAMGAIVAEGARIALG